MSNAEIEAIENRLEGVSVSQQNENSESKGDNQNDGNRKHESNNATDLIRAFVDTSPRVAVDDSVALINEQTLRDDWPLFYEKYQFLSHQIGTVVKVEQPEAFDGDGNRLDVAEAIRQSTSAAPHLAGVLVEPIAVVEFNLVEVTGSSRNNNNNHQNNNNGDADLLDLPGDVLRVAIPSCLLDVLDRGVSALDLVVDRATLRLGGVGGFRLNVSVCPIRFPQSVAQLLHLNQPLPFDQEGAAPAAFSDRLQLRTRTVHCTDLIPANPFRRTVGVVDRETRRVGFVDEAVNSAVILLDNGSLAICSDVDTIEKELTQNPRQFPTYRADEPDYAAAGGGAAATGRRRGGRRGRDGDDNSNDDGADDAQNADDDDEEEEEEEDEEEFEDEDDYFGGGGDDDGGVDLSDWDSRDHNLIDELLKTSGFGAAHSAFGTSGRDAAAASSSSSAADGGGNGGALPDELNRAIRQLQNLMSTGAAGAAWSQRMDDAVEHLTRQYRDQANNSNNNNNANQSNQNNNNNNDNNNAAGGNFSFNNLPPFAERRPALGWFRRVKVRHSLVRKRRIFMAFGQPDFEGNARRGYDEGTIICLSPASVYVRWTTPHFDPNTEPPPPMIDIRGARDIFILQHFYSELLGVGSFHDVAFLRTEPEGGGGDGGDGGGGGGCTRRSALRQKTKEDCERRQQEQQEQQQQQQQNNSSTAPPRFFCYEEVDTATGALDAQELNEFYNQFIFPESVADAKRTMRRLQREHDQQRNQEESSSPPSLLSDPRWGAFFTQLSQILRRAVRVVDCSSRFSVLWADGSRDSDILASELLRQDQQEPLSIFEHVTAHPRDVVYRNSDRLSASAVQAQQLTEDANSNQTLPRFALDSTSSAPAGATAGGGGASNTSSQRLNENSTRTSTESATAATNSNQQHQEETCAMFDITRSVYPDYDCVVSDIVTMRTQSEQAQILSLAGSAPNEVGVVQKIDLEEMTVSVAWYQQEENQNSNSTTTSTSTTKSAAEILMEQSLTHTADGTAPSRLELDPNDRFARDFIRRNSDSSKSPFHHSVNPSNAHFMVGQVMAKHSLHLVEVRWWDGSVESIDPRRLTVHHLPFDDVDDEEEFEEEEEEEEGDEVWEEDWADENEQVVNEMNLNDENAADEEEGGGADQHQQRERENEPEDGSRDNDAENRDGTPAAASATRSGGGDEQTQQNQQQNQHQKHKQQQQQQQGRFILVALVLELYTMILFMAQPLIALGTYLLKFVFPATKRATEPEKHADERNATSTTSSPETNNDNSNENDSGDNEKHEPAEHNNSASNNYSISNNNASNNNSNNSDSSVIPATSTPGTFQSCSRFSAHLLDDAAVDFSPSQPVVFTRRLLAELKALRQNPLTDIFVKANDDRSHCFKFAILGAVHTPYYGDFLAFDMILPASFPQNPPTVRFHSRNMRLNPNLYEDGHVCLSLLGTWNGHSRTEQWQPGSSTLRQVLLSIQALILNKEPYFNEAGFDERAGTSEGLVHSRIYNESVVLVKIAHLMHMAEQPPPDWIGEFREHYSKNVPRMIARWRKILATAAAAAEDGGENSADVAGGGAASSATSSSARPQQQQQQPRNSINADGLIYPLSSGLKRALEKRIEQLQKQHDTLTRKWEDEAKEFEAAFD